VFPFTLVPRRPVSFGHVVGETEGELLATTLQNEVAHGARIIFFLVGTSIASISDWPIDLFDNCAGSQRLSHLFTCVLQQLLILLRVQSSPPHLGRYKYSCSIYTRKQNIISTRI